MSEKLHKAFQKLQHELNEIVEDLTEEEYIVLLGMLEGDIEGRLEAAAYVDENGSNA